MVLKITLNKKYALIMNRSDFLKRASSSGAGIVQFISSPSYFTRVLSTANLNRSSTALVSSNSVSAINKENSSPAIRPKISKLRMPKHVSENLNYIPPAYYANAFYH
ncbi:MAG: hypothetical protein HRT51_14235 [Colwellia sp.]|nr:hypothetical protein [Colwellia sp.]